ncbi:Glucosylceramidase [Araneus ventricosus]|uniref:Glucosylceramidase n=1 Tax=Araneus ventricosus TaxID=182803 RepID=A0A4Y2CBJ9_ARAVE|nr:Glucosylceramidase [Araneus ventricosus]
MDFTDLKSTLAYSMKFESAKTASKTSIHARSMETDDDTWKERDDKFESLLKALEKLVESLAAEQNAPRRNPNLTCWKCFKKGHVQRACQVNDVHSRKLTCGRLAEQKIPTLNKSPEEGLKVSTLSGGGNGLYLKGSICDIPCLFLVDTGTNITLLRADLAHKVKERLIYTAPNLTLKTATGEKAKIQGKLDASIECGSRKFQHRVYVADITDSCILGLDFLQKFKFTVDLEKNEIRTGSEKISLFSDSTQHRKRTSDGKNVQSRQLCFEGCEPCSNAEKKFRTETDISVEALTMATENRWSLSEIQKAQLEDPDIRPILKMKLNSADRPSWQEIAHESPATKRYWALWNSLYLKDGNSTREVLRETHDNTSGRHFGVMKTLRKTRERFYWDRLRADVEKWCWECQACGARKGPKTEQRKSVTGRTPAETFSDRTLRFPCDILFGRPRDTPSSPTNSEAHLESVQASAGEQVELSRERMKIRYDSRATDHPFKEGDLVWMYNPKRRRGLSPKLQQNREGPYTVVKKLNDVAYRVQRSSNAKPKVIHINRLAPYRILNDPEAAQYVSGIAFHWYGEDLFPHKILDITHRKYPGLFYLPTEACTGSAPWEFPKSDLGNWNRGERYAHDIIQDLLNWSIGWIDWNLVLDMQGGPNWVSNFVDAPIIVNVGTNEFYKQPMYYALAHFSKCLPRGSYRIGLEVPSVLSVALGSNFNVAAFQTPQDKVVVIAVNRNKANVHLAVYDNLKGYLNITVNAHSIQSYVW